MEPLPVTVYKSWFGYFVIALSGLLVIGLVWIGMTSMLASGTADPRLTFGLGTFLIVVTALITFVQLYVYSLSFITIMQEGIVVRNWITLFVSVNETFEWQRVTKAEVGKVGIFAQVIDYGTLSIGTSDGDKLVSIRMIPSVERWQALVQQLADAAPVKVTDVPA